MREGCLSCGARSVGEPLPRPEHELPSYARSLVLAVTGSLMALVFVMATIIAMAERATRGAKTNLAAFSMLPSDFWSWMAAAETASWRLKWAMIPLSLFVVFAGRKIYRSVRQSPARFCGVRYARNGYVASLAVPLLMLILIGITVPTRLRHRAWGIEAATNIPGYTMSRAISEYSAKFEKVPNELADLKRLPDPDGSIAAALNSLDPLTYPNAYRPYAEVAAKQNPNRLRGAVIRNASLSTTADESVTEGLSFTGYELRLPGPDKLMDTEDDLLVRDGVIYKVSDLPRHAVSATSTAKPRHP